MAMSSGDSLYVATRLLSDPASRPDSKITRLRGNVGRAGIVLLISPDEPRIRELDPKDWNLINHDEFDGAVTDCFSGTSLHMSFTEFVLPIDTGQRGFRDTEIFFLETVISTYDKGSWVGDLKVLPIFEDPKVRIITQARNACKKHLNKGDSSFKNELVSIDSWYEFIDRPEGSVVFRAHENWMARLSAASMSVMKGYLTVLNGGNICWHCVEMEQSPLAHGKGLTVIL